MMLNVARNLKVTAVVIALASLGLAAVLLVNASDVDEPRQPRPDSRTGSSPSPGDHDHRRCGEL